MSAYIPQDRKKFNNLFNKYTERGTRDTEVNKGAQIPALVELIVQWRGERPINNYVHCVL